MILTVRSAQDPRSLTGAIRRELSALDPDLPAANVRTLEQVTADSIAPRRLSVVLIGVFAAVALVLASVGIYGVMSFLVVQRTHEIGVRMALGAQRRDVLLLVVGRAARLLAIGSAVGLVLAIFASRALGSLLYNVPAVRPADLRSRHLRPRAGSAARQLHSRATRLEIRSHDRARPRAIMSMLGQDIRYGLRMMWKSRGFTSIAVLSLALGIGANTAVFSVVNAVLLRPLPFPASERLMAVWETMLGNDRRFVAPGNFTDWQAQSQSFAQLAAYTNTSRNLTGRGEPQKLSVAAVSTNFFATLEVAAEKGRTFLPEDATHQDRGTVVLSHALWQTQFGSDPRILGQDVSLDGRSYNVIGIMPRDFGFPARAQAWVLGDRGGPIPPFPPAILNDPGEQRDVHFSYAVGRLKDNVTRAQAQAEMSAIAHRLALSYPKSNAGLGANVITLHEQVVGSSRLTLFVLLAAVALVLLIACANVANLLLAWATKREREIAIRLALGAGRWRLIRQMLTESVMLSLTGGLLGLVVAIWAVDLFVGMSPPDIPRLDQAGLDGTLLAFTAVVSLLTGIAFGAAPAWRATRLQPQNGLQDGGAKSDDGPRRKSVQNRLVIAEIALAQMLLVGAGLFIMSFARLQATDPGFKSGHLLTGRVSLPEARYSEPEKKSAFYDQTLERVDAIAGVQSAALVMSLPLSGGAPNRGFQIEGRPEPKADESISTDYQLISPGYFATMEIPLIAGRPFGATDNATAPRVTIINQTMARKYFPGENPIGKRVAFGDPKKLESWRTIVGVAGDVRYESIEVPPFPLAYAPYQQNAEPWSDMAIVLRTRSAPSSFAASLRQAVLAVDPNQPLTNVQTMEELMAAGVTRPRFTMLLIGTLAGIALALAAVGIYGVMAYSVAQRTREIGIRMALGAQARDVLGMIVRQGMTLALVGIGLGTVGALGLTRLIANLLFGVNATDPLTFAGISLLLAFVALLACYLPARRAAKLDPMVALART